MYTIDVHLLIPDNGCSTFGQNFFVGPNTTAHPIWLDEVGNGSRQWRFQVNKVKELERGRLG